MKHAKWQTHCKEIQKLKDGESDDGGVYKFQEESQGRDTWVVQLGDHTTSGSGFKPYARLMLSSEFSKVSVSLS